MTFFRIGITPRNLAVGAALLATCNWGVTGDVFVPGTAQVQASPPLASVGSSVLKSLTRYFGKEGTEEATEYLAKSGSRELVERVASTASREGGEETVERVSKLVGDYGPDALKALDNTPSLVPVLNAIDELPAEQAKLALSRFAAGQQGRELAEAVTKFGGKALRSELKHPGVGLVLVRTLGDDGVDLAARLGDDQAIAVARHSNDIATLPPAQRDGVLSLLRSDAERVVAFMGRFAEANPGKTLFTVATTGIILAEPERILGGDEIVFDAEGNPIVVSKSGLMGRTIAAGGNVAEHVSDKYIRPLFFAVASFIAVFAGFLAIIKLWHLNRREQLKTKAVADKMTHTPGS